MATFATARNTGKQHHDGSTIYVLKDEGTEILAVAGPAGHDATTIDSDNLPAGFFFIGAGDYFDADEHTCRLSFVIDHEPYGETSEFDSLPEAEKAIRDCGPEFSGVTLRRTSDNLIRNERDEVVGSVNILWPA